MIDVEPGALANPEIVAWVSDRPAHEAERVAREMAAALRVHPKQAVTIWSLPGCVVGMLASPALADEELAPARSPLGHVLWMTGEIFDWPSQPAFEPPGRTGETRRALLAALVECGAAALNDVDGEYLILLWSPEARTLRVFGDRFGSLPAYWASTTCGAAIASGVRGVLLAPGVDSSPDSQALREAVTFGGYRLGSRTNVDGVAMLPPAGAVTVRAADVTVDRYWRWSQVTEQRAMDWHGAIDELQSRWARAIARRLAGARRPGLHLSGGLDSRAILAEAIRQNALPAAVTFGVPESDEVIYAGRAAAKARVPWTVVPLFRPGDDWVGGRESFIQHTDGLIDLADLKHLETLGVQARLLDVHLSGYIGDVVVGPRYNDIARMGEVLSGLPFYGGDLGMSVAAALGLLEQHAARLDDASLRFFIFEHKFPQSLNRWTAAWRPWLAVRKPFTAYSVFDFCQQLPAAMRRSGGLRERWVRRTYPELFKTIPDHRTGVPVLTPWPLWQLARISRAGRRRLSAAGQIFGVNGTPRYRSASPDDIFWRVAPARERIERTILRAGSIACDVFGRDRVERVVDAYFECHGAPTQVVGALFSFEAYHRDLTGHLADSRRLVEDGVLRQRQAPL